MFLAVEVVTIAEAQIPFGASATIFLREGFCLDGIVGFTFAALNYFGVTGLRNLY